MACAAIQYSTLTVRRSSPKRASRDNTPSNEKGREGMQVAGPSFIGGQTSSIAFFLFSPPRTRPPAARESEGARLHTAPPSLAWWAWWAAHPSPPKAACLPPRWGGGGADPDLEKEKAGPRVGSEGSSGDGARRCWRHLAASTYSRADRGSFPAHSKLKEGCEQSQS